MYEDLDDMRKSLLDKLRPCDDAHVARIRRQEPQAPRDYIEFLRRFGAGRIGRASYMLYDGLVPAHEIYGETPPGLEDVVLFGDDMSGYTAGFDRKTWKVVERSPLGKVKPVAGSFEAFIRKLLGNLRK